MNTPVPRPSPLAAGLLALVLVLNPGAAADNLEDTSQRLQRIRQQIQVLQQTMEETRDQYGTLQAELRETEQEIGLIAREIEDIAQQLTNRQQTLDALNRRRAEREQQLAAHRKALAAQVRAAYIMGRQDYLKILLNQQQPARLGRILTYYDYFNRARARRVAEIKLTLERIRILEQHIEQEKQTLGELRASREQHRRALQAESEKRQGILKKLLATMRGQNAELTRMRESKRHLETLLLTLQDAFDDFPRSGPTKIPFQRLRGRLEWPVKGKILHTYGSPRGLGSLKWQGMVIAAESGDKVRGIAPGRVVFADWFRNYGQLLIIEHDDGYMSLYGYNQSLYKHTGDWVEAGEEIASVGSSGGQEQAALYFEIRRRGSPLNPGPWLAADQGA